MRDGLDTLSERERETLRLLMVGHDAKSIAGHLGLSVHTINERLRDARRKLGVSSSREAARLLAEAEHPGPHSLGDKQFGVSSPAGDGIHSGPAIPMPTPAHRLAWLSGGMLIMSLVIAAAVLAAVMHGSPAANGQGAQPSAAVAAPVRDPHPAGLDAAREWLALLDQQRWQISWDRASSLFRSGIAADQWAAKVTAVRQPLGAVSARSFQSATDATSLPGGPTGQYEILQFQTSFAHKPDAIETVVLVQDDGSWKTAGYFIR